MLRLLILVLGIGQIVFFAYLAVTEGRHWDTYEFISAFLLVSFALLVIFYVLSGPSSPTYLGLFFERRRLEEQAKIDKLKSEAK